VSAIGTALAGFAGFATFFPIGLSYFALLALTIYILAQPGQWAQRSQALRTARWPWIAVFFCVWPLLTVLTNAWFEGAGSRLFHIFRVAFVLCLGLMMLTHERRAALIGLLLGAWAAAMITAVHRIHPLPDWEIWSNLLLNHAHRASQKHIAMATVCGLCIALALRTQTKHFMRIAYLGLSAAMLVVVIWHATSRNAHVLVLLLPAVALVYRFRSFKAWVLALTASVLVAAVAWTASPPIRDRFMTGYNGVQQILAGQVSYDSVGLRYQQWKTAYDGMVKQPVEGTGLASWLTERAASVPVGTPDRDSIITINNPHNDYLLFGMETGIPGMLSLCVLLGWFMWRSWKSTGAGGDLGFVLAASVAITAVFNAPVRDATLGMALMWLMAVACSSANDRQVH
jgi:O-antigen ligase